MLDPDNGRAQIRRDGEALIVEIPAKRQLFVTVFLGFWLGGWAMGWFFSAGVLIKGDLTTPMAAFLIMWLAAWTIGGFFAIAAFLWEVAGREIIRFSTSKVDIIRHVPFWRKVTTCRFDALRNMRRAPIRRPYDEDDDRSGLWLSEQSGMIKISYGARTLGFGLDLDDAEIEILINTIGAIFPELTE